MPAAKPIFATPQDVENAFYEALERADLDAMMTVWAEDEEIICVHPGSVRHKGYSAVRETFRRIFSGQTRLNVQVSAPAVIQGPLTVIHNVIERIAVVGEEGLRAPVIATNIYVRGAWGWRMIVHHASPAPPDMAAEPPKILH